MKYPIVVPGAGPIPCRGMIVGEAPGREEIKQGIPFVGKSGNLLVESLAAARASRWDFYITNIFKGDVGRGNRNPTQEELADHWRLFLDELKVVAPERLLILGTIAADWILPAWERHEWALYEPEALVTWHPSYVLRRQDAKPSFMEDVRRFVEATRS